MSFTKRPQVGMYMINTALQWKKRGTGEYERWLMKAPKKRDTNWKDGWCGWGCQQDEGAEHEDCATEPTISPRLMIPLELQGSSF